MDESQDNLRKDIPKPGSIAFFGSGETTTSGRKIFAGLFQILPDSPEVAILGTIPGDSGRKDRHVQVQVY